MCLEIEIFQIEVFALFFSVTGTRQSSPLGLRNVRPRRSRYGQTVLPRNEENKDRK